MAKNFNVTAVCISERHYMVNIEERLKAIKALVDDEKYFTINRARQYGKTTTLIALERFLKEEYYVVFMDFQMFGNAKFKDENTFSLTFASFFIRLFKKNCQQMSEELEDKVACLQRSVETQLKNFELMELFEALSNICSSSDKPIVLIIDEVDSVTNNQVFLDFLSQLRAYYIQRDWQPTFHSVILAGVYDVKNLKRKLRPEEEHRGNSPWNIAADFNIDMGFSKSDIAGMLEEYESDYRTGMNIGEMAGLLYDYTAGYPFLVSRLCKLLDEEISMERMFGTKSAAWTQKGLLEAVKLLLNEKNTLFESLSEKLTAYPELNEMLRSLLFTGKNIAYNFYEPAINIATMFGFVKNQNGVLAVSNRIFDTWLYNLYLSSTELQNQDIYKASLKDKNQFIVDGHLNMRRILERFALHFEELYGDSSETFLEEEGRKYFLLYLRPIINGTGNYYIESRTRSLGRTDIIVDYRGEQFVVEMKIWHGNEYNARGESQLAGYLEDYHLTTGYMISFNFNKKKNAGIHEIVIGDKRIIEAVI